MCVCTCISVCVHLCIHICMHVCMCCWKPSLVSHSSWFVCLCRQLVAKPCTHTFQARVFALNYYPGPNLLCSEAVLLCSPWYVYWANLEHTKLYIPLTSKSWGQQNKTKLSEWGRRIKLCPMRSCSSYTELMYRWVGSPWTDSALLWAGRRVVTGWKSSVERFKKKIKNKKRWAKSDHQQRMHYILCIYNCRHSYMCIHTTVYVYIYNVCMYNCKQVVKTSW